MKTATICSIIGLQYAVCAFAEDAPSLTAVEEAAKNYLNNIDKAQDDYLNEIRLALRKTEVIEVFRIGYPGKKYADPFGEEIDPIFVEPYAHEAFKVLESARIDKAKEVFDFLEATFPRKSWDMLMFSYIPRIGFRCLAGESELFVATVDPKSQSLRVVFPDGQWTRMGIDVESTRAILKSKGINLPEP